MKTLPGLEIFYNAISKDLKTKDEAIVALLHYTLIYNGYNCIGLNEQFEENAAENKGSELLPTNWNEKDFFILRYVETSKKDLLLVKIIPSGSILLINLLLKNKDQINATTIDSKKLITDDYKEYKKLFLNEDSLKTFVNEIKTTLAAFEPKKENPKTKPTSNESQQRNIGPLSVNEPSRGFPQNFGHFPTNPSAYLPNQPFPQVGAADLDPLGRGIGGGMLMDPRNYNDIFTNPLQINQPRNPLRFDPSSGLERPLPPGAVPPGARFEYIGPPSLGTPSSNRPGQRRPPQNHPDLENFSTDYDNMFM